MTCTLRTKDNPRSLIVPLFSLLLLIIVSSLFLILLLLQQDGIFGQFNPAEELSLIPSENRDFSESIINHLPMLIKKYGFKSAFEITREAVNQKAISLAGCHNILHQVGHLSYEYYKGDFQKMVKDIENIRECSGAGFHGMEGQLAEFRQEPFAELRELCIVAKMRFPRVGDFCYHGAGHGFMRLSRNVNLSLAKCRRLIENASQRLPCDSGVFSEFGAQLKGTDTDTGKSTNLPPLPFDFEVHPLEYCSTLESGYLESCTSQLTKVLEKSTLRESVNNCMWDGYERNVQEICMKIVALHYSGVELADKNSVNFYPFLNILPQYLKESFIQGVGQSYFEYSLSRKDVLESRDIFCSNFTENKSKEFCLTKLN